MHGREVLEKQQYFTPTFHHLRCDTIRDQSVVIIRSTNLINATNANTDFNITLCIISDHPQ